MRVMVTGASGYIGGRLVSRLLAAGHSVRCAVREPARMAGRFPEAEIVHGDAFDPAALGLALTGMDVAFYLIHSMAGKRGSFETDDRIAAENFARAARLAGIKRIVYLGGLGKDGCRLSKHLRSRHEVGEILRASGLPVTEFRAAIIVGSGSVAFEMLRYLTERLPLMIAPKWVRTLSQPIAIADVLAYLVAELEHERLENVIYEIGGRDKLSYAEMMLRYASMRGLRRAIVVVPFFTPRLSSAWVHLVTPIPSSLARPLIDGLHNEVIVGDGRALRDFPIRPMGYDEAVRRALDRYEGSGPETTWFDAYGVRTLPGCFLGAHEGMLIDRQERISRAGAATLFSVFSGLGGKRGWLSAERLWQLRGKIDRWVGGVGLRRGRRTAMTLRVGDAVDFWRVEAYEPDKLLRLRAEMRLPGKAWLQFEAIDHAGGGSTLRQTAFFEPRGILGHAYWYVVMPFHQRVFGSMADCIVSEAEKKLETPTPSRW